MAKLPVLGRQQDRCDVCGRNVHRKDLIRTQVRFLNAAGQNYFVTSTYDSTNWACNGTDKGNIAIGPNGDAETVSISIADGSAVTERNGEQTWSGSAKDFRSITAVDVSGATTFCVSAEIGPWFPASSGDSEFDGGHAAQTGEVTVAMGLCDADGNNKALQRTWTAQRSQARVWFQMNVADIASPLASSGIYVYFTITLSASGPYWYVTSMQLEKNVTSPGVFKPTTGAAVDITDTKTLTVRKVCPRCREPLLRESQQFGRPRTEVESPIPTFGQEV
jgi:hypothetical protein